MGNMFQLRGDTIETDDTLLQQSGDPSPSSLTNETFTPRNRTNHLFTLMDEDTDGKADFNDFKRTVLNDAEIIQGFLVYDGVI